MAARTAPLPPTAGRSSRGPRDVRLAILDDFYPNPLSAFRDTEFNGLLDHFPRAVVRSAAGDFGTAHRSLAARRPDLAPRVEAYQGIPADAELAYVVGLNTAARFLPDLEAAGIPFVVELYPGFGLWLGEPAAESRLAAILDSPGLARVIVTQPATREHLRRGGRLDPERMTYLYGFVTDTPFWNHTAAARPDPGSRPTADLAFVAQKYTQGGRDKGFDVAVAAFRVLGPVQGRPVRLHVVGSLGPDDADLGRLRPHIDIIFHGPQPSRFFPWFHRRIDAIVSPNAAGVLGPGAFDGFPTGAVAEAMLLGVPAFVTDPLGQNETWEGGRELVIIERDPDSLADALRAHLADPVRLAAIGAAGQARARVLFDLGDQLLHRIGALEAAVPEAIRR